MREEKWSKACLSFDIDIENDHLISLQCNLGYTCSSMSPRLR
jgi:hypothetical protein